MNNKGRYLIINDDIRSNKIMLLDEEGEKIGVFSKLDALAKGQTELKDVIQIGFNQSENMVIAKFMEVGKYTYLQKKKEQQEKKKGTKGQVTKEIKFGYAIGENDLNLKINKAKEFLDEGFAVKFNVVLKGRENAYKNIMQQKLQNVLTLLENHGKSQGVKEERNGFIVILFPKAR